MSPVLSVLTRNRDFRYLFLAELVVFGGDWFALIPLMNAAARPHRQWSARGAGVRRRHHGERAAAPVRRHPRRPGGPAQDHDVRELRARWPRSRCCSPYGRPGRPGSVRWRSGWRPGRRRSTSRPPARRCRTWSTPRTCRGQRPGRQRLGHHAGGRGVAGRRRQPVHQLVRLFRPHHRVPAGRGGTELRVRGRCRQPVPAPPVRPRCARSGSRSGTSAITRGCSRW